METIDISTKFNELSMYEFEDFLFNLSQQTKENLILIINTDDIRQAKTLKAVKEYHHFEKFTFDITITATPEEKKKNTMYLPQGLSLKKKHHNSLYSLYQ
jgi:hypothetical protein